MSSDENELSNMPANEELVEVVDTIIWNMSGEHDVPAMRAELLERSDASNPYVQRAVAVCDEYLAPHGSPEAIAAQKRAWGDDVPC